MGVKGLTTYLKENRRQLSHTHEFRSSGRTASENVKVVVDGWSLVYAIYLQSGEPWVYGGEYLALSRHTENVISAWMQVGFRPTLVFDGIVGPTPSLKYPTLIARLQDSCVKPSNLFFRTSQAARTTPRSLWENRIAPPLGYTTIVSTLVAMEGVDVKFAEGEADAYIVKLAGELRAFVIGKDSDFVVLNAEGYRGYIPLDELVWSIPDNGIQIDPSMTNGHDSDFRPVSRKKQRKPTRNDAVASLIPPIHDSDLVLLVTIYEPAIFASHVDLPVPLLPLLGALIGNDYASLDFFRSSESVVERVRRVALTLSSVLKDAQSNDARKVRKVIRGSNGGATDVIGTAIERLLLWRDPSNPPTNGEIDRFTETIVQSTLEYAVGTSTSLFPHYHPDGTKSETCSGRQSLSQRERVQDLYERAYHQGVIHYRLMEAFCRGVCFPALFLEDPDKECVSRTIGRPIRNSIWQLFVAAGGIPEDVNEEVMEGEGTSISDFPEQDEDELIDVIEEDSDEDSVRVEEDPLAVLRGRIQRMSFSESENGFVDFDHSITSEILEEVEEEEEEDEEEEESIELPQRPKSLTEYLRKGSRVAAEKNEIVNVQETFWYDASDKIPVQLRSLSERTSVFLKLLGSDTSSIRAMITDNPSDGRSRNRYLFWVLAYRWVVQTLHSRCEDSDNINRKRLREQEKWTRAESEAFFYSLCFIPKHNGDGNELPLPPVTDRGIQLTAQLLAAFEAVQWLAQALLLMAPSCQYLHEDRPLVLGEAEKLFSGRVFHARLTEQRQEPNKGEEHLWAVASEGIVHMLAEPKGRKVKKVKEANPVLPKRPSKKHFAAAASSRFSALADLHDM